MRSFILILAVFSASQGWAAGAIVRACRKIGAASSAVSSIAETVSWWRPRVSVAVLAARLWNGEGALGDKMVRTADSRWVAYGK
jgi:hypothetical protein